MTELITRRRQIIDILTAKNNRLKRASKQVAKDMEAHLVCPKSAWTEQMSLKRGTGGYMDEENLKKTAEKDVLWIPSVLREECLGRCGLPLA